jgi:hypothetical protein
VNVQQPVKVLNGKEGQLNPDSTVIFQNRQLYQLVTYFRIVNVTTERYFIDIIQRILTDV